MEQKATTVIFKRDGRHAHTLQCTPADAARWAEENEVFMIVVRGGRWAVNHVNSGKIITDDLAMQPTGEVMKEFLQIANKES